MSPDTDERFIQIVDTLTNRLLQNEHRISQLEQSVLALMQRELNRPSPLQPPIPAPPQAVPDSAWIPVLHHPPPIGCGKPAQYITRRTGPSDPADRTLLRVRHPERGWVIPDPTDEAHCSTCGASIDPHGARDLDWGAVFNPVFQRQVQSATPLDALVTASAQAERRISLDAAIQAARTLGYTHDDPDSMDRDL